MKQSKMLELVENLKVGEKVVIEKFKDHLFIEKKLGNRIPSEWIPAPSDNINIHGVDLSILNEEDWFYVETDIKNKWIAKHNIIESNGETSIHYNLIDDYIYQQGKLCNKDDIILLRKATDTDLAPFFEKHPEYEPAKVGDWGVFYDDLRDEKINISNGCLQLWTLGGINNYKFIKHLSGTSWKHFFKVQPTETLAEIKERFLKEKGRQ